MNAWDRDWGRFSDKIVKFINSDEAYKRDPSRDTCGSDTESE